MEEYYKRPYLGILKKTRMPFVKERFEKYVRQMVMQHVVRRISAGCGLNDRYLASPSAANNTMVLIDGKTGMTIGSVQGMKSARDALWVQRHN